VRGRAAGNSPRTGSRAHPPRATCSARLHKGARRRSATYPRSFRAGAPGSTVQPAGALGAPAPCASRLGGPTASTRPLVEHVSLGKKLEHVLVSVKANVISSAPRQRFGRGFIGALAWRAKGRPERATGPHQALRAQVGRKRVPPAGALAK